ncbi:hypothetical protein MGWOODY_Mmi1744 [hydrothermal vent metagenome]|uniref:Uncharacterized protein n=1 Tax=hydrothermal vent metagenome TaxID=652676 RepID=A0A160VFQ2_9ZZZZ
MFLALWMDQHPNIDKVALLAFDTTNPGLPWKMPPLKL